MTSSFHLPFTISPRHQILTLRNLIADYYAQVLVRGKHLPLIDQLSFGIERLLEIFDKSSIFERINHWSLIIANSLKIVNCKLIIASEGGV